MSNITNNYQLLIQKLDKFIRKYYTNKLIKGLLFTIGFVVAAFITVNLLENALYFSSIDVTTLTKVRKGLFYGFLGLSAVSAVFGVFMPLLNIFNLGRVISHQKAAEIVGQHFTNVKDKLLNVLQLKEQSKNLSDASLIEASINQKIDDIKLVPFANAINLSKNKKYLKYALIPLVLLIGILFGAPNFIKSSTDRLINNDEVYEKAAPFSFEITNKNLEVIQYEDLSVEVKVDGIMLPNEVFVNINNFPYKLKKHSPTEFSYTFNKIQKETTFNIEAGDVKSMPYTIKVIPKPTMLNFDAKLDYPSYTGKTDELIRNSGDMVVPTGTKVRWTFEAQHTDDIKMKFQGKKGFVETKRQSETSFTESKGFYRNTAYAIYLSNNQLVNADSISYNVTVIPDLHPTVSAEEKRDSADNKFLYFYGDAADDYGIKRLVFNYKIESKGGISTGAYKSEPIALTEGRKASSFTHMWNLNYLNLQAGDKLNYFFEVWDNDGVNGSKSARTQMMHYELPTHEELDEIVEANNEELKEDLEEVIDEAKKLKEEAKDIKEKLVQKKDLNWEDKAQLKELLDKHRQMEQKVQSLQQNFNENLDKQEDYKEFSENIQEKQEKLQELFEEVMTDELKELMEKLEALMDEMQKEDAMEELEDFEMTDDQLEEELDRMLELFKQLEFEQKMEETIDKLQELAEEEEKLAEETEQKPEGSDMKEQEQKQEEIQKEFEKLKEDVKELDEMAEELDQKMDMDEGTKDQQQEAQNEMQQGMQKMEQKQSKKASENQKNAAQKMQEMANKMQMMQMEMQQEQHEEDMQAIRQLLENLVNLSMDQEKLMQDISEVSINTPMYTELVQIQHKLKDDAELVEDSLISLSKRVFQLESFISDELNELNRNMNTAIEELADRKKNNANSNQQFVMTSANNLALMLNEVM